MKKGLFMMLCGVLTIIACNSTEENTLALFESDGQLVNYTEDIAISIGLEKEPEALTFVGVTNANSLNSFNGVGRRTRVLGNYQDPIFGSTTATAFAVPRLGSIVAPDFEDIQSDSLILRLELEDDLLYGDTLSTFSFEVYRMTEAFDLGENYFSNQLLAYDAQPIGKLENVTIPRDTMDVVDYISGNIDTIRLPAHVSIPMAAEFIDELVNLDASFYESEEKWLENLKGLAIKVTDSNNALVKVDFASPNTALEFFYQKDSTFRKYNWFFTSFSGNTNYISHDYTNSIIEEVENNPTILDTLIPIQGLVGTNVALSFDLSDIPADKAAINKAELVMAIRKDSLYTPIRQLVAYTKNADGNFIEIPDATKAISIARGENYDLFGGTLTDKGDYYEVTMNIPRYIQSVLKGESDKLYIRVFPLITSMRRSLIFGPGHENLPMKLKLTYSIRS